MGGNLADVLSGLAGNDIIIGLAGDDTIFGCEGEDILAGAEADSIRNNFPNFVEEGVAFEV